MIEFSASMWMHLSEAHTVLIIFMKFFNNKILKQRLLYFGNVSPVISMTPLLFISKLFSLLLMYEFKYFTALLIKYIF